MKNDNLLNKLLNQEFILYIFSGIIVTSISWLTYTVLENYFQDNFWRIANLISIVISILLAYLLNRRLVFKSTRKIFPEIIYFFFSRFIISLIFEHGTMELLITVLGFDPRIPINGYEFQIVKAIASIFVVLANYLVGKYWVFQASQSSQLEQLGDE